MLLSEQFVSLTARLLVFWTAGLVLVLVLVLLLLLLLVPLEKPMISPMVLPSGSSLVESRNVRAEQLSMARVLVMSDP